MERWGACCAGRRQPAARTHSAMLQLTCILLPMVPVHCRCSVQRQHTERTAVIQLDRVPAIYCCHSCNAVVGPAAAMSYLSTSAAGQSSSPGDKALCQHYKPTLQASVACAAEWLLLQAPRGLICAAAGVMQHAQPGMARNSNNASGLQHASMTHGAALRRLAHCCCPAMSPSDHANRSPPAAPVQPAACCRADRG